jgi:uncharacterized membrane protein
MNGHLSPLGIFHTAISVLPIGIGAIALLKDGKIDIRNWVGKSYLFTMLIGSLTAFGISKNGGFNFGHVLSLITVLLLTTGYVATRTPWFQKFFEYVEAFSFSASYLLLMVFTTTETLTRLPVGNPIASGPDAAVLESVRFWLLMSFLAGLAYQFWTIREGQLRRTHERALDVYVARVAEV